MFFGAIAIATIKHRCDAPFGLYQELGFFFSHCFKMAFTLTLNAVFLDLGTRTGTSSVGSPYLFGLPAPFLLPPDGIRFFIEDKGKKIFLILYILYQNKLYISVVKKFCASGFVVQQQALHKNWSNAIATKSIAVPKHRIFRRLLFTHL